MDFPSIANRIYMCVSCLNFTVAVAFLTLALLYRRRCFNFPTLLACNTAAAVLFYSAVQIVTSAYIFIWDPYSKPDIDSLCPFRAYLQHTSMACTYHSFILLAVERFAKIRQMKFLRARRRKIYLLLFQWIFDFSFTLPVLLTGNMVKFPSDNFCFVSLTRIDLVLYQAIVSFLLTDITLSIIYRSLIHHVRQVSSKLNNNQQLRMQRDLKMVRRIVLLNSQLALTGIPALVLIILTIVRTDLLPYKTMRTLLLMTSLPYTPMLIILLLLTPDLRQSLIECRNRLTFCRPGRIIPAGTTAANARF